MGIGSLLGLGGGASVAKPTNMGFNKWEKQGKIGLDRTLNRSGMTYGDRKKVKKLMHTKLTGGKKLSHDQIMKEVKKEFGYNLGKRVEKALAPKPKEGAFKKPSLHEQVEMKKEAEQKKKVNVFLGLKSSEEVKEYKEQKGAVRKGEEQTVFASPGQKQQTEQEDLGLRPAFQGIGSSANKPAAPPPDTTPKAPPPSIPLSR